MLRRDPIGEILAQQGVVVIDGGLATELERRGAYLKDSLWSAKLLNHEPELIQQLHADYFAAGADVAITASYQASFEGFHRRGLSIEDGAELMRLSVRLAQAARDAFWADEANRRGRVRPLVAASIGCYGAYLANGAEYTGDYRLTRQELIDWHRPRMRVLVEADPDLLAFETIPSQLEGEALLEVLCEFPHMPAWLSFSCCDDDHVCHGERFADCVALANQSAQIVAVGLNCTSPRFVAPLIESARAVTDIPLLCYPNSGESWDGVGRCWVEGSGVTDFGPPSSLWLEAGARLIGGCCRTGPEDVRVIAQAIRQSR